MKKQYILYGYVRSRLLREITERYININDGKVLFYVDDSAVEKNVYSSDIIIEYPNATVLIMCSNFQGVLESLRNRGIENTVRIAPLVGYRFIVDQYRDPNQYKNEILNFMSIHYQSLKKIYNYDDEITRVFLDERYSESLDFNLNQPSVYEKFTWMDYYADEKLAPEGNITYVDCGGYTGDTIRSIYSLFGNSIKKIYAYEPDTVNMKLLQSTVSDLSLKSITKTIPKGVYDHSGYLNFSKVDDELEIDINGKIKIPVDTLDNTITEVEGTLCIKMDLEGSECAAIKGAYNTIKKYKPYMAICIYHRMRDILDVPETILDICDEYDFYLRSGLHTEVYAIPKSGE